MPIQIGEVDSRGGLNPNESRMFFKSTGVDEATFSVRAFEGEEAISRVFRFTFDLRSDLPDVAASDVLGKTAVFLLRDREIHGVVSEFSYEGLTRDEHIYRAVLRPRLWVLSLRRDSEIFLDMSGPEVIKEVLSGLPYSFNVRGYLPAKEYVVQYNETDLDFLQRTAEHWGICFRFAHEPGGGDVLELFTDSTDSAAVTDEKLRFDAEQTLRGDRAAASVFTERELLVPGRVLVKDYNYRDPETALLSEIERRSDDFRSLYYEYGTHHGEQSEGDYLAKVRSEEIECRRRVFSGVSNWHEMEAGFTFELEGHPREAFNGKYLITSVTHRGSHSFGGTVEEAEAEGLEYENSFTCIPAAVPFRPARMTPIPKVAGVMTAKIESGGGDYAHIDSEGRYSARMHFDLSDRGQAEASAPIRMNQPYSGPGYGMHFPNHANTEIVWACINGDPNRPIAIGTAPNPSNASPVTANNRAQSVIRTEGQNEIMMDDTRGAEMVFVHATRDNELDITNDQTIRIGGDRSIAVGGSHDETIGGSMSLSVGSSSTEDVGTSKTVNVGASYVVSVGASMSQTVGAAATISVGGALGLSVGASVNESVQGNKSVTVAGSYNENVSEEKSVKVSKDLKEMVDGKQVTQVAKEYKLDAKKMQLVGADEVLLKSGSAQILLKKNGDIVITGKNIKIEASSNMEMKAGSQMTLKGSQIKEN